MLRQNRRIGGGTPACIVSFNRCNPLKKLIKASLNFLVLFSFIFCDLSNVVFAKKAVRSATKRKRSASVSSRASSVKAKTVVVDETENTVSNEATVEAVSAPATSSDVKTEEVSSVNVQMLELQRQKEKEEDEYRKQQIDNARRDLNARIDDVKTQCSGIRNDLDSLFGLSKATTIVSGVGTVMAGGALAAGLMKNKTDKIISGEEKVKLGANGEGGNSSESASEASESGANSNANSSSSYNNEEYEEVVEEYFGRNSDGTEMSEEEKEAFRKSYMDSDNTKQYRDGLIIYKKSTTRKKKTSSSSSSDASNQNSASSSNVANSANISEMLGGDGKLPANLSDINVADVLNKNPDMKAKADKVSKTMGHVRTGLMAGATVTSAVSLGTSVGSVNSAGSLADNMSKCNSALSALRSAKSAFEVELDGESDASLIRANGILSACSDYDKENVKAIKNIMTASSVTSGIGTATGLAGTITSAMANSNKVRGDNSEKGTKKEKNLNMASNILAGVTTGTSASSAVLGGISMSKVKKDFEKAERCESALANY